MTISGNIKGIIGESGTSDEVEIGGAKWSLFREHSEFQIRCAVGDGTNVLWDCTATGRLTAWHFGDAKKSIVGPLGFSVGIKVMKLHVVDLSTPPNKSITSLEDAACLQVEDKELWVSKKVLSFHSPFFKTMFSSDFKENATGYCSPKEVNIVEFKMFLSVLYNLNIPITAQKSLEGLLRLAHKWQCDLVLRFCHDILRSSDSTFLSLEVKIKLCDRHGFWPLLSAIVDKAEVDEVKQIVQGGCDPEFRYFTVSVIMNRLAGSS
uniref:BTB domain-containing protein n=1 Tax=Steinernema glaseri TaxID=37863 RepID=A0A1I8AQX2_9BILA